MTQTTFETYEELLNFLITKQTNYELRKDIKIVGAALLTDKENIKLLALKKSDHQIGLVILYKAGNYWFYWYPSEEQQEALPEISNKLLNINYFNQLWWNNDKNC